MPKYSTAFGMDVHLRSTTVCALDADTGEAVTRRFPGNPWGEIAGWMDGFPGPSLAAYESGYLGFAPQRELSGLGVDCVVAAVSKVPRSAADFSSKNDRNDAARMAKAILSHDISPVWVLDWQHLFGRFREGQPRFPELDRRHVAQRRVDPEVVVPVHVVRELGS